MEALKKTFTGKRSSSEVTEARQARSEVRGGPWRAGSSWTALPQAPSPPQARYSLQAATPGRRPPPSARFPLCRRPRAPPAPANVPQRRCSSSSRS